jgi:hypothetical protein
MVLENRLSVEKQCTITGRPARPPARWSAAPPVGSPGRDGDLHADTAGWITVKRAG